MLGPAERKVLWDMRTLTDVRQDPIAAACALSGGGLRPDQWARFISGLTYVDACRV